MNREHLIIALLTAGFILITGAPGHIHVGGYGEAGFVAQGTLGIVLLWLAGTLVKEPEDEEPSTPTVEDIDNERFRVYPVCREGEGAPDGFVAVDRWERVRYVRHVGGDWVRAEEMA